MQVMLKMQDHLAQCNCRGSFSRNGYCRLIIISGKKSNPRPLFRLFSFFKMYRIKTVDSSGIRTWIVSVEGEHADHLTATTAPGII